LSFGLCKALDDAVWFDGVDTTELHRGYGCEKNRGNIAVTGMKCCKITVVPMGWEHRNSYSGDIAVMGTVCVVTPQ